MRGDTPGDNVRLDVAQLRPHLEGVETNVDRLGTRFDASPCRE
jgi:hypothetical protein